MSLAKKTVLGAIWTTAASIGGRLIGVISTFILTRFLMPSVQGEVNVAFIVVATASMVASLGLGQYVVSNPKAGRDITFHVTFYYVLVGCIVFSLCYLLRDVFGRWMNSPTMGAYLPGLILSQTLDRFASLPRNILARDMRFKILGLRMALGEVVYAGVTIFTAWLGWGGQSIVAGNIARGLLGLAMLGAVTNWRDWLLPCRLSVKTTRMLFNFGLPITVANVFHYGAGNWDNLIMANRFGDATVGLYNQAYKLADLPATHIGEQIGDVLVPSFAAMEDKEDRKRALTRAAGLLSLIVFPLAVGLGAIADTLVRTVYSSEWLGVAPLLMILSILSVVRPVGWLVGSYLQVVARTRAIMLLEILKVTLIVGSMFALSPLGPLWTAAGVGIGYGLNALTYLWSLRSEGVTVWSVLRPLLGPLLACVPMAAGVFGVRYGFSTTHVPMGVRLLIEIAVGGLAYVPGAFVCAPSISRDLISLLKKTLGRRRGGASESENKKIESQED